MARHIKKGDMVEVIAGADKGKKGRVLRILTDNDRVVVEGVNRRHKHVKPSRQYPQGGRVQIDQSIHISNVLPVSTKTDKGTRVKYQTDDKGTKKRVAVDGSELGVVKR